MSDPIDDVTPGQVGIWMTTNRLSNLVDGIFTFAMTLLVLTIDLPRTMDLSGGLLHRELFNQWQDIFNYALSFILLATFWMTHHVGFHNIKRTDGRLIWINIFTMLFVVLVPYATSLVGDYNGDWLVELIFTLDLFLIGLGFWVNWVYATYKHRLVDPDLSQARIARGRRRGLIVPAVSLVAMILALLVPGYSSYAYISIPILLSLKPFRN